MEIIFNHHEKFSPEESRRSGVKLVIRDLEYFRTKVTPSKGVNMWQLLLIQCIG